MIVETLSIGLPKKEVFYGKEITTAICKRPVSTPLHLRKLGFEGDGVADLKNHGGPDKAVCVYSLDHYPYWEGILGTKLAPAAFGENLSVSSLKEDDVCIGDIFQLGTATVQISQPRQACKTLAARYGKIDMVRFFTDSGFTGLYLRVLEAGVVQKGDLLTMKHRDPGQISVAFANQIYHHDRKSRQGIEAILGVSALSHSWQQSLRKRKEKCTEVETSESS
ncbi:MAG: MOSC domain-containing protein [Deltaproteobacteria bacterium]|nr:MAG: MOSC domain-containing protein [Deltaproteobacteria bacterium]